MTDPTYFCPYCGGSESLLVYAADAYYINTMDLFCHSSKPHDQDARCECMNCGWEGEKQQLKEQE